MKRIRNFTGDDLALAEQQMQDAYLDYLDKKSAYDYSMSVGHASYARRKHLGPMNTAKAAYDMAVGQVDTIIKSIDAENAAQFKANQQTYIAENLATDTAGEVKQTDYTTWIYIGIAVLVIAFFWKRS